MDKATKGLNGDAYLALQVDDDAISRDVSLRSLVRERFAAAEAVGSKRRYSRHAIESIEPTLRTLIPLLSPRAPQWSIDTTRSDYVTARASQELVDPSSMKSPNPSFESEP
ncbi:hypothetical protein AAVH_31770 [Aphelenchoides avenae]|nr:hypothetical protein AAVH_31770 [Aphelenchus avenae]